MKAHRAASVLIACAALLSSPARAAEPGAIALDRLDPAPAGDPFFGVPGPFVGGHLAPRALVLLSYADEPLATTRAGRETLVVGSQSLLQMSASLALWDRVLVSALLPVALDQSGEGAAIAGVGAPAAPTSPAAGDLRLGARVRVFGGEGDRLQVGAGFTLHLPTGDADAFMGESAVRISPQLLVGGRVGRRHVWSVAAGAVVRSSENPSTFSYGLGAGVLLWRERLQLGPEIYAQTPMQGGSFQLTDKTRVAREMTTSAELLLGARLALVSGFSVGAAAGPGFGAGLGTPTFRGLLTIGWAKAGARTPAPELEDGQGTVAGRGVER